MASPDAEEATISHFRQAATAAFATHDRPSFESALHTLCINLSTPLQDVMATQPQVAALLQLAADRHWIEPTPSWVSLAKRAKLRFMLPLHKGKCKASFRRWKWDAASLTPPSLLPTPDSPEPHFTGGSETSSIGSGSSPHSSVRHINQAHTHGLDGCDVGGMYSIGGSAEFEAALLSGMPRLADARPAGAAAAAAFRALAPFLPREERAALRQAFGKLPPVDCLAMVVRVAEMASEVGRGEGVWGLPGGGGVWRGGVDEIGGRVTWEGVYRNRARGLDVNAPSFHVAGLIEKGDRLL